MAVIRFACAVSCLLLVKWSTGLGYRGEKKVACKTFLTEEGSQNSEQIPGGVGWLHSGELLQRQNDIYELKTESASQCDLMLAGANSKSQDRGAPKDVRLLREGFVAVAQLWVT